MSVFEWLVIVLLVLLVLIGSYISYGMWTISNYNLKPIYVLLKTSVLNADRIGSYANEIGVEVKRVNAHLRGKR